MYDDSYAPENEIRLVRNLLREYETNQRTAESVAAQLLRNALGFILDRARKINKKELLILTDSCGPPSQGPKIVALDLETHDGTVWVTRRALPRVLFNELAKPDDQAPE